MAKHRDPEWLREKYVDEGLSDRDIADIVDRDASNVTRARQQFGIEGIERVNTDAAHQASRTLPRFDTSVNGYERIRHCREEFKLHRLAAVAWFGWDAIVDNHIHHESGVPWDNREENLTPMGPGEHHRHHTEGRRDVETGRFI